MGSNGLSKVATNPVVVGVRLVTVRPRVAIVPLVPAMVAATASVTVMFDCPEIQGDAENATPLVSVVLPGSVAAASLLLKWIVPV